MQPLAILFGASYTCAVSLALGGLLLRDACRDPGVRFVSGAAMLSLLVCALCSLGLAYPPVLLLVGCVAIGAGKIATRGSRADAGVRPPFAVLWKIVFGIYVVLYLSNAMAPEVSPDGAGYHLGLVARYLRPNGRGIDEGARELAEQALIAARRALDITAGTLAGGASSGELRKLDTRDTALLLWAGLNGVLQVSSVAHLDDPNALVERWLDATVQGLTTH